MRQDRDRPERGIVGDIICGDCQSVITAVQVDAPGLYIFTKIAELPPDN